MNSYISLSRKILLSAFFCHSILVFGQNLKIDSLLKQCNVTGSVTIYDYNNKSWMYSDQTDASFLTLPASTFKIFNSLFALETKVLKDENEVIKWDGVDKGRDAWNADTDLKSAFKNSTVWFYQEIARRAGRKKYEKYLRKTEFGNQEIGDTLERFWLDGSFRVSPRGQILFLIDLYENKLPFSKKNMKTVKEIMITETTDHYTIRAKTGWGFMGEKNVGWWVGYVETKTNVFFFATRILLPHSENDDAFANCRKSITRDVLKELGAIK